jgi:hypothetical protein
MYTEKELNDLEAFFNSIPDSDLPSEIELLQAQKVIDVKKFYENTLRVCRAYPGSKLFQPAYDRLLRLKELLANK